MVIPLFALVAAMVVVAKADAANYLRPGCLDSCSDQVNCSVSLTCHDAHQAGDPDIPAEAIDVQVTRTRDQGYQYLTLTWNPPADGSFNYLTGFLVQVSTVSWGHETEQRMPYCFDLVLQDDWSSVHRRLVREGTGVKFYLNCLRDRAETSLELKVNILSKPLKPDSPKYHFVSTVYHGYPDVRQPDWDPQFEYWADTNNTMHLVLQNPLREAKFYEVQILSVSLNQIVFSHTYPATVSSDNQDRYVQMVTENVTHYLVPGLPQEGNLTIYLDALDDKMIHLSSTPRIMSLPFQLNFSNTALAAPSLASKGLDNSLITIVSVIIVVAIAIIVCLVWKGVIRPGKIRAWLRRPTFRLSHLNNGSQNLLIVPVYCYENEDYVSAVESHVALLRRYVKTTGLRPTAEGGCRFNASDNTEDVWINTGVKDKAVIVYLSPRIQQLLCVDNGQLAQLSEVDSICHQALCSLKDQLAGGQGAIPLVVTLGCFDEAELPSLDALINAICPHQHDQFRTVPQPVILAAQGTNGSWRLENLETILQSFRSLGHPVLDSPQCLAGWNQSEEAKSLHRHLALLCGQVNTDQVIMSWERGSGRNSLETDSHFQMRNSSDDLNYRDRHEEESQQEIPLISKSSGFHSSASLQHSSDLFTDPSSHRNGYLKSLNAAEFLRVDLPATSDKSRSSDYVDSYSHHDTDSLSHHCNRYYQDYSHPLATGEFRTNIYAQSNGVCKPDLYSSHKDTVDSNHRTLNDADSLLKHKHLNGYCKNVGPVLNGHLDQSDLDIHQGDFTHRPSDVFIPPSLCLSNSNSLDSVCERLNKVNENAGWSDLNLAV